MRSLCLVAAVLAVTRCGSSDKCEEEITLYQDVDGDGWGSSSAETTTACFGQRVAGYTNRHGDCDDSEPRVFPGQKLAQRTPTRDENSVRAWDFNCDGFATLRWRATGICRQEVGYCAIRTAPAVVDGYWSVTTVDRKPPACGVEATWIHWCRAEGPTCTVDSERRVQECL